MNTRTSIATAFFGALLCQAAANAQFGPLVNLPHEDFIWNWGRTVDQQRRVEDFSMHGSEGGFRCELKGRFSPSNTMTEPQMREFETNLGSSLYFIQEATYTMNELDRARDIDWAELDCKKPQPTERDEQETQERVDRAREKAVEDMLRRREKRERDAQ